MNNAYSKDEIIAEAVYNILINDTANTGNDVREIMFYFSNVKQIRYGGAFNVESTYPMLTYKTEPVDSHESLPTGRYFLSVTASIESSSSTPQTTLKRIMARVDVLIDKKPEVLNSIVASAKNLRCRRIKRVSAQEVYDAMNEMYKRIHIYDLTCDDENLN